MQMVTFETKHVRRYLHVGPLWGPEWVVRKLFEVQILFNEVEKWLQK